MPITSAVIMTLATAAAQLADLVEKLNKAATDRKLRDLIEPVNSKALEVQQAALDVQREQLRIETDHSNEVADLKTSHANEVADLKTSHANEVAALKEKYAQLEAKHAQLKKEHAESKRNVLTPHHGLLWDTQFNPHCPVCRVLLSLQDGFQDNPDFGLCMKCKSTYDFRTTERTMTLPEIQALIRDAT